MKYYIAMEQGYHVVDRVDIAKNNLGIPQSQPVAPHYATDENNFPISDDDGMFDAAMMQI